MAAGSAPTLVIVRPAGQTFGVNQSDTTADGGTGTVDATGKLTVTTAARGTASVTVSTDTASLSATVTTTAGIGDQVAIVQFFDHRPRVEARPHPRRRPRPPRPRRDHGLAAPRLDLRRATALLATNTGWSTSADSAAIADSAARVGAFAAGSADAALIVNLAPGAYTAQVTGLAGATGTTLLEASELP